MSVLCAVCGLRLDSRRGRGRGSRGGWDWLVRQRKVVLAQQPSHTAARRVTQMLSLRNTPVGAPLLLSCLSSTYCWVTLCRQQLSPTTIVNNPQHGHSPRTTSGPCPPHRLLRRLDRGDASGEDQDGAVQRHCAEVSAAGGGARTAIGSRSLLSYTLYTFRFVWVTTPSPCVLVQWGRLTISGPQRTSGSYVRASTGALRQWGS